MQPLELCRLVLAELVQDIEAADPLEIEEDWPDLFLTYGHALMALERTGEKINGQKATVEIMRELNRPREER